VFVADAPKIDAFLSEEAQSFFARVTQGLDAAGVAWVRSPTLVRGLDYYRHTAFEFITDRLGAQGTVLGGGRYDGLMESLGGAPTPAVGWAAGIERLAMLVADAGGVAESRTQVTVVVEDDRALTEGMGLVARLRQGGMAAELIASGSPRKRFDKAVKSNTQAILALGWGEEGATRRLRNVDGDIARIEALIA